MTNTKKTGNKNHTGEPQTTNESRQNLGLVFSVANVRKDLLNVIDTMGPTSPLATQSINGDADNEESLCSSLDATKKSTTDDKISIVEDSQMTICNISELTDQSMEPYITTNISRGQLFSPIPHSQSYIEKHGSHLFENDTRKILKQPAFEKKSRFANWFGVNNEKNEYSKDKTCDFYKINIEPLTTNDKNPPRRLVFDLMDEMPKADTKTIGTNTKQIMNVSKRHPAGDIHNHHVELNNVNMKNGNQDMNIHTYFKGDNPTERVDIYYFDHGNSEYYRTTASPPVIMTEYLAERTEHYTTRFWAQIFGTIHIGVSFVTSFILQLVRFILQAIIRPLTVGLIQLFTDYLIKPFLAVIFNGIVQPPMIFLYNFATSLRDLCEPLATSMGYFLREMSVMCKAIRLVQVDTTNKTVKPVCGK